MLFSVQAFAQACIPCRSATLQTLLWHTAWRTVQTKLTTMQSATKSNKLYLLAIHLLVIAIHGSAQATATLPCLTTSVIS